MTFGSSASRRSRQKRAVESGDCIPHRINDGGTNVTDGNTGSGSTGADSGAPGDELIDGGFGFGGDNSSGGGGAPERASRTQRARVDSEGEREQPPVLACPRAVKDSSLLRNLVQLGSVAAIMFTARASLADHYRVPTGSMEPTVHVGDHIVVSKIAYGLRVPLTDTWLASFAAPRRGDVVILDAPNEKPDADVLLKRVVATGGESVEVRDGHVYVEGRAVDDRWASLVSGAGPDFGPSVVPQGRLLVLGDNRGNSHDGRYFGFVEVAHVLGRAVAVVARDGRPGYDPL